MVSLQTSILSLLNKDVISLVDVGSSGGLEPRWQLFKDKVQSYLFEPDARSFEELAAEPPAGGRVYPHGLGRQKGVAKLFLCRDPQKSSLLQPNFSYLARFPDKARFDILNCVDVLVETLDHSLGDEATNIDFMKLDTQGTELDILAGAHSVLSGPLVGLEIEVEFLSLYQGQPLFGEICQFLSDYQIEFVDFTNICRWERDRFSLFGQAQFGDALFLRPPEAMSQLLAELPSAQQASKARRYLTILALYRRPDLIAVGMELFGDLLEADAHKAASAVAKALRRERRRASVLLRVANRVARSMGLRLYPIQVD